MNASVRHRLRRGLAAVEGAHLAAAGVVVHEVAATADARAVGLGHAERGRGRDGRVDRVAAPREHAEADLRGLGVDRGDRAAEAAAGRRLRGVRRVPAAAGLGRRSGARVSPARPVAKAAPAAMIVRRACDMGPPETTTRSAHSSHGRPATARRAPAFARVVGGYAAPMSDETPSPRPSPARPTPSPRARRRPPRPAARCARTARPRRLPGGHDDDVSGSDTANKHASESGGHTIDLEDEQPDPDTAAGDDGDDVQEENAETSLDQPSEG